MMILPQSPRKGASGILALGFLGMLASCSVVGPTAIRNGRMAYAEAIEATESQQMLSVIVRHRYGEQPALLAVASVTANMRIRASAEANAGIGDDSSYAGNLVPFSAGMTYEENPTISYQPIQGEKFVRQLLSPIPLDVALLLIMNSGSPEIALSALIERVNEMTNPVFSREGSRGKDPDFHRFVELFVAMGHAGCGTAVVDPEDRGLSIVVLGYAPEHVGTVQEMIELLGMSGLRAEGGEQIVVPVALAVGQADGRRVSMQTRSVYDLLQLCAACTDVPREHLDSGLAREFPSLGLVGKRLHIHCSETRPDFADVAVQHHGQWFYIDARDQKSKQFFFLMETLFSLRISETASTVAPVLTVPVSR